MNNEIPAHQETENIQIENNELKDSKVNHDSDQIEKQKNNKKYNNNHDHHDHHDHDHLNISKDSSVFSIIVVLIALGIHAFMANLAVGIENNEDSLICLLYTSPSPRDS